VKLAKLKSIDPKLVSTFGVIEIKDPEMIFEIPHDSIFPFETHDHAKEETVNQIHNIHIIPAVKEEFPKPPRPDLQYRVIYFYKAKEDLNQVMNLHKKELLEYLGL
jgi:hypothetical protein